MLKVNKILVVIDPASDSQPALARACLLASKTQAEVVAFMCIYDFSYEMTTMLSYEERDTMRKAVVQDRGEWLAKITSGYTAPHGVTNTVVWDNSVHDAAIKHAIEHNCDMIVKAANSHDDLASLIFTPTDWHLLRKSPTPVLMVKQHDWPDKGNIIASVNVGTEDQQHAELNDKVAKSAQQYAEMLNANLHLVNAYPGTALNIAIEIPEFDPQGYTANVAKHHQDEMKKFAEKHGIAHEHCHVKQGLPETAVPGQADELDAELVIIGTIGRVGLSAALIGNTAEHVIDALNCDVLAIKPDGFECPIHT
jgi:universal stress protein E